MPYETLIRCPYVLVFIVFYGIYETPVHPTYLSLFVYLVFALDCSTFSDKEKLLDHLSHFYPGNPFETFARKASYIRTRADNTTSVRITETTNIPSEIVFVQRPEPIRLECSSLRLVVVALDHWKHDDRPVNHRFRPIQTSANSAFGFWWSSLSSRHNTRSSFPDEHRPVAQRANRITSKLEFTTMAEVPRCFAKSTFDVARPDQRPSSAGRTSRCALFDSFFAARSSAATPFGFVWQATRRCLRNRNARTRKSRWKGFRFQSKRNPSNSDKHRTSAQFISSDP